MPSGETFTDLALCCFFCVCPNSDPFTSPLSAMQFNKALEHGGTPATPGLARQQLMMSTKSNKSPEHQPNPPAPLTSSNPGRRKETSNPEGEQIS